MSMLSRRRLLASGAGLLGAAALPNQSAARPLIALPDDLVNADAATITAVQTPSAVVAMTFDDGPPSDTHPPPFGYVA